MAQTRPCPANSFVFNSTLCACNPGYVFNSTRNTCIFFKVSGNAFTLESGIDYSLTWPLTIFSFDSIKKFTQSQAVFLEATCFMLLSWLLFCFLIRLGKLGDGRTVWFQIRWWISRLDFCFANRHWLDDQKVVLKRKTELGGTFSIASWILFIGLLAALLYQIISKRSVEVHNVRATNAPDLMSFKNDMEFNITTISSMSCSNLRKLSTVVSGTPGFPDYRSYSLSSFANYSCHNTSWGPTVTLKCNNCQITLENLYVSWQFVDIPNAPATAVGFQFNVTVKNHGDNKHVSFISGTLKNTSNTDDRPTTFRGVKGNILKFNLFPRLYHNLHDLKLLQPLFLEFIPGSSISESSKLRTSLESNGDGLINMTLYIHLLSAYIIEINNQNIHGPVGFLADLGGLYSISIALFFYCLVNCEYRIKKLRNEDSVMLKIRNRRKAQDHWNKLRKYVIYRWGSSKLDKKYTSAKKDSCCCCMMIGNSSGNGSSHVRKPINVNTISFNRRGHLHIDTSDIPESPQTHRVNSCLTGDIGDRERRLYSEGKHVLGHEESGVSGDWENEYSVVSCEGDASQPQVSLPNVDTIPPPPPPPPFPEFKSSSGVDISDVQRNLQNLYEYNVLLREKFVAAQSMLQDLAANSTNNNNKI
ncbi:hypothetical protein NE237_015190 [Protea cynaroides]|uniref:Uncharacterized protein n=1 Tax=Protea cynaroides TaxID=273540 RepID=A0A9Q0QR02_9MAGN|nr:hypothetical protein NE237_015190 [Protea cynaroides]